MALNPRTAAVDTTAFPSAFFDFGVAQTVMASWLQVQQQQMDALLAWQRSMADMQQDLWDQWICHWGGGVPLDG